MILPTAAQMLLLAPGYSWQEPDYHDEIWKYDPSIALAWDTIALQPQAIAAITLPSGTCITDGGTLFPTNAVAALVEIIAERNVTITIPPMAITTIVLADLLPMSAFMKIVIVIGKGARVTIRDARIHQKVIMAHALHITLAPEAHLIYDDQQTMPLSSSVFRSIVIHAQSASECVYSNEQKGASYTKTFWTAVLEGEHAQVTLTNVVQARDTHYHSLVTEQYHMAAATTSSCSVKYVQYDASRTTYHGMIVVETQARGSNAQMHHKALLVNAAARAIARPVLQAKTNDIQCSHASAIGRVDEELRWYLESRALDPLRTEQLLVGAFLETAV
jgi:Fe-S cluster assembly protein SufD